MDNNVKYDFCPKCGALVRDGICTSCGFGDETKTNINTNTHEESNSCEETNPYTEQNENPYVKTGNSAEQNMNPYANTNPYGMSGVKGEYQNNIPYFNGAIPQDVPAKKKNGKVGIIVGVCIGIFVLLIVLLGVALNRLVVNIQEASSKYGDDFMEEFTWDEYEDDAYDDIYDDIIERADGDDGDYYDDSESGEYYEFEDMIRYDLDYYVEFESEEFSYGDNAYIYCAYPVLSGDIPNIDLLNEAIYYEYLYFEDYFNNNVKDYMSEGEYYNIFSFGYVTYMDEEKISIVFSEEVEVYDSSAVALYCINIDVKNGVVMDNTQMLNIDDAFISDFREREAKQNQSDVLEYYSDVELAEMLMDEGDLVIFYTPMGIEVGINHDFGWCTVTYKDYEQFLKQF